MAGKNVHAAIIDNHEVDSQVVLRLQAFRKQVFVDRLGGCLKTATMRLTNSTMRPRFAAQFSVVPNWSLALAQSGTITHS